MTPQKAYKKDTGTKTPLLMGLNAIFAALLIGSCNLQ
jgi:hypothetical protein